MKVCKHIQNLIETEFPISWFEDLDTENLEQDLIKKSDSVVNDIYEIFYQSILSGEYIIQSHKKLNKKLDNLRLFTGQRLDIMADESTQEILEKNIKIKIINSIGLLISAYKLFTARLSLLTAHPFHEIGFDINFKSIPINSMNLELKQKLELFYIFLNVQLTDHFFNDGDSTYKLLTELLHKLKRSNAPQKLKPAVIEKINFLKHKWILRQIKYSENDHAIFNKGYIEDGEIREIFEEEEYTTNNEVLKEWGNYLEDHYELSKKWRKDLIKSAHKLKKKEVILLSLMEVHRLIKFYKDIQKNPEALRDLAYNVVEICEHKKGKYNKKVWEKAAIYSLNNYYSLALELKNSDSGNLNTIKTDIETYQKKFSIDNFFADKKYIDFQLSKTQKAFNNRKTLNNLEEETSILEYLTPIMKRCEQRMQWAYTHHSLIFQLPYKSSLVPTAIQDFPGIYYASTFALPIPKHTNQKEFNLLQLQFDRLNLLTKTISSLSPEFKEVSKIQSDLKDNDFKSIEVIGVFTAIITFVISSIPGFKFIDSFEKAIYFYGILGCSLTTMILVILLLRRGSKSLSKNLIPLISLILILIFMSYSLYLKTN